MGGLAGAAGDAAQAKALLAAGADPGRGGPAQGNCLHLAAAAGDVGCMRVLLAHCGGEPALLRALDASDVTPLTVAVRRGNSACLAALLDAGAGKDRPEQLATPLVAAVLAGDVASLTLL